MRTASRLKGGGYLTSTVSVILLGIPGLKSASENSLMLVCLLLGMAASVMGMGLRWWSHRVEQKDKDRIERKAESTPEPAGRGRSASPA
jgi:hypothetical protein